MRMSQALSDSSTGRFWCDEQPGAPLLVEAFRPRAGDSTALLIGPEGGWTEPERAQFSSAGWQGVSLGPQVLRAETAVCAALAVIAQKGLILPMVGGTGTLENAAQRHAPVQSNQK